jgi:protein-L-isoaspartate(D-aspartate) O-methyltransferase
MDYARARHAMVESQIRTADVTDPAILAAMRSLPRELFAPERLRPLAYGDLELEVASGRTLLRPRDLGKLLQSLEPRGGERGLEIAGATAYGAAVLARCGLDCTTLEADGELSAAAGAALEAADTTVRRALTAFSTGWPELAPYDVILVNGGVEFVPEPWLAQLAEGGRLGVIVRNGAAGSARIYSKSQGAVAFRTAFDAAPPVLPGLERPRTFVF